MINIFIDGIGDFADQKMTGATLGDIKKALGGISQEARDQCCIIVSENNRRISLHSALKRAKPIIRIVGEMDNPAMLSVAEALEPLKGTFDLQLTDGVQIDSYRSFLKTLATLPTN